ncbi:exodeoxyribonuclease V subunit alpha [Metamycoplasma neophronis]|uniref:Exodeoxyribonuclease V subunit alpha n=2 Tax=Metamycoplasma neophronis TaxID=872983 RepID=A0ABY2Z4J0_9BACT|nr:exodeoxyribonuclease V subunit alpha [Metamycoplasma neophronis]
MNDRQSIILGNFTKVLWASTDKSIVIASFKVLKNDAANEVKLNKFNSIAITIKNNTFIEKEISLGQKNYEIIVAPVIKSKYPNSYQLVDLRETNDDDTYQKNYIVKFLKSAHFRGIGEQKAWAIVNELGLDALKKIAEDSGQINYTALGISEASWDEAKKFLKENPQLVEDQMLFLKLNLSPSLYEIILKKFENLSAFIDEYQDNFYRFYLDNQRIKLEDMDKLTNHFLEGAHPFKPATHIYRSLSEYFFDTGNTRILRQDLYDTLLKYATSDVDWPSEIMAFNNAVRLLKEDGYLISLEYFDGEYITTKNIYEMETYIIKRLKDIELSSGLKPIEYNKKSIFHDLQLEAIKKGLSEKLLLITGSPGTGKTLITNEIISSFLKIYHEDSLAVLTPTGRATININNKNEKAKAVTIHSFLEWDPENDKFNVNEKNPKSIECLIIDEFSMVSVDIFYALLKGINPRYLKRIILVGDKDQLPAIGPGYLIHDFIENKIFDTIYLQKIYRQAENYDIVNDAITINRGEIPSFEGEHSQFLRIRSEDLHEELIKKIQDLMLKGYSKRDIAVLSPIYNYETGINELNNLLSTYFRKLDNEQQVKYRDKTFAIDDKIINLVNDPRAHVFNGEIGYISWFTFEDKKDSFEKNLTNISVDFEGDDKTVTYSKSDFNNNTALAYCTSVHKYQGSECKAVIVVLFSEAKRLLSKKLIYTAITRAKQYSCIMGELDALYEGIHRDNDSNRITNIKKLWEEEWKE